MRWWKGMLCAAGVPLACLGLAVWARPLDIYDDFTSLEQIFHGVQHRWTVVGGYRMHYEVEGPAEGPPVILIHGLGGRADDWRSLAPHLARAGYRVYMPDLIGYGRSEQPLHFSYSIGDEARLLVDFMDTVGLKRVDLGGWSMGGWIAQVIASRHPARIKRLMLFDSAGLHVMPSWNTSVFTPQNFAQLNELNKLLMANPPYIPHFIGADILRVTRQSGWVIQRAMAQMLTGEDATDDLLPQLPMPVLLEWGAEDRIIPVAQAATMHRLIPDSHLDLYPGCGHLAPLRCAAQMGPNVVHFLKSAPAYSPLRPLTPVKTMPLKKQHAGAEAASLTPATARAAAAR